MFIQQGNTGPVGNVNNIINALPAIKTPTPVPQLWINGWQLTNSEDAHAFAVALRTNFPIPNAPGGPASLQILKIQTNALHM